MSGRALPIAAALAILTTGCRFGGYAGSVRGRGTRTFAPAEPLDPLDAPGPTTEADASVSVTQFDLTSDYVAGRTSILTTMSMGSAGIRNRVPMTVDGIQNEDDIFDFAVGAGLAQAVADHGPIRVSVFGLAATRFLNITSHVGPTFSAGVQLDMFPSKSSHRGAMSARLAAVTGSATMVHEFDEGTDEVTFNAIMLQVGGWFQLDLRFH